MNTPCYFTGFEIVVTLMLFVIMFFVGYVVGHMVWHNNQGKRAR